MKFNRIAIIFIYGLLLITSCGHFSNLKEHENLCDIENDSVRELDLTYTENLSGKPNAPTFFGDSTLTIVSSNRPNGYLVKFFQTPELTLLHLSRGNINRYIALHEIPWYTSTPTFADLQYLDKPLCFGTYIREIEIPVVKELDMGLFFMDVNFDGEEELVIEYNRYNRYYYACFDLVHGSKTITPGIMQPMEEEPFNNIVAGKDNTYTEFDYDNKTIHIYEQMGCCSHVETWCAMIKDGAYNTPKIRIVRKEDVDYTDDGYKLTKIYERVDGELKEVSNTREKIN